MTGSDEPFGLPKPEFALNKQAANMKEAV